MTITKLDHVNICTARLAETVHFYEDVLGMSAKPPPMCDEMSAYAWIYDGNGSPVFHLVASGAVTPSRVSGFAHAQEGSGAVDHVALECDSYDDMLFRLKDRNIPIRQHDAPAIALRQIFLEDPNGVTIELNFR